MVSMSSRYSLQPPPLSLPVLPSRPEKFQRAQPVTKLRSVVSAKVTPNTENRDTPSDPRPPGIAPSGSATTV